MHPALCSWTEANRYHASFNPGSVQAIKGFLVVEQDHDAGRPLESPVSSSFPQDGQARCSRASFCEGSRSVGVPDLDHTDWPKSAGKRACGRLVVLVQQRDRPVAGCPPLAFVQEGDAALQQRWRQSGAGLGGESFVEQV